MEKTDRELLERARRDDADAFGELVDRYKHHVTNYLTRLTGCRERAEDFAQETFVRLYQTLGRYRDEGNLTAYLFRIATNLVRSDERRRRRWSFLEPLVRLSTGAPAAEEPQETALAKEERREVTRAIAALKLTYRVPLVLREIEGRSYHEIAAVMGLSEGTVKSRLHRARQLLKEELTPYWQSRRPCRESSALGWEVAQ